MGKWSELFERKKCHKLLGIEWFAESLKIVEMHSYQRQFTLKHYISVPLNDARDIENILRDILLQIKPETYSAVTALAPALISRKIIDLDHPLTEMEIYRYLSLTLENHFGIAAEQLYFDFKKILVTSAESQTQKIEVIAARRSDVDKLHHILKNTGLAVIAIDTPMDVLSRINKLFIRESGFWFYLQKNLGWLCWQDEFFQSSDIVQFNYLTSALTTSEFVMLLQHQLQMMLANMSGNFSRKIFLMGENSSVSVAHQLQENSGFAVKIINPISQLINKSQQDLTAINCEWIFACGLALWRQA